MYDRNRKMYQIRDLFSSFAERKNKIFYVMKNLPRSASQDSSPASTTTMKYYKHARPVLLVISDMHGKIYC
jgi:hypothetical protein